LRRTTQDKDISVGVKCTDTGRVEFVMKRISRFAEYEGWMIEASPTFLVRQRLFVTGVIVSRGDERFVFHDLGNRVYRWQACERGIEWAKQWIDNNYRYRANLLVARQNHAPRTDAGNPEAGA
jgi:hypothetical protein